MPFDFKARSLIIISRPPTTALTEFLYVDTKKIYSQYRYLGFGILVTDGNIVVYP